jgi:glycosylphosphatidylinositol transamidase (GPIT) subunit GPI8
MQKIADAGDFSFYRTMFSRGLEFMYKTRNCSAICDSQAITGSEADLECELKNLFKGSAVCLKQICVKTSPLRI